MTEHQTWTCADFRRHLTEYSSASLPDDDQVRAQAHVDHCDACRSELFAWERVRTQLQAIIEPTLSRAHSDTLWRSVQRDLSSSPKHARRSLLPFALGGATLAALGLLLMFLPRTQVPVVSSRDVVMQSDASDVRRQLSDRVEVTLAARTELVWNERTTHAGVATLRQGQVTARLDPLPANESLTICTRKVCARAIGTAFTVASYDQRDRVDVEHGVVAVFAPDAPEVQILLAAGEHFEIGKLTAEVQAPQSALAPRSVDPCAQLDVLAPEQARKCMETAALPVWFSAMTAWLGAGDLQLVQQVFARTSARFAGTSQHETVLFALAKLEMQRAPEQASARLTAYSRAYPRGTFAENAAWLEAILQTRAGKRGQAIQTLEAMLAAFPNGPHASAALFTLATFYESTNVAMARALYQRFLARPYSDPEKRIQAEERLRTL